MTYVRWCGHVRGMNTPRKAYGSDVTDAEWTFLLPYLCLMREDAPQREHSLRELFNALRYMVKTGCTWRFLPHDFPPWTAVYQQARRWLDNGVFEQIAHDLRAIVRVLTERQPDPSAVIFDARTLQSTPESGSRAGFDGHKKKHGSKVHVAVDALGHLLALVATPANEQERPKSPLWRNKFKPPAVRAFKSPSSIKATPEARPLKRRRNKEFVWTS